MVLTSLYITNLNQGAKKKEEDPTPQQQKQSVHFSASPLNLIVAAAVLTLSSQNLANPPGKSLSPHFTPNYHHTPVTIIGRNL